MNSLETQSPRISLALVFLFVSVFSFVTGLVLGAYLHYFYLSDITSSAPEVAIVEPVETVKPAPPVESASEETYKPSPKPSATIQRYKDILDKTLESETKDIRNNYAVIAATFLNPDLAMTKSIEIKEKHNSWNISILKINKLYRVVLGTFSTAIEAQNFRSQLPKDQELSSIQVLPLDSVTN